MSKIHGKRRWLPGIDGSLRANRAAAYVARRAHVFGVEDVYVLKAQPLASYRAHAPNRNEVLLDTEEHGAQAAAVARKMLGDAQVTYRVHVELRRARGCDHRRSEI